jgi:outer membrane protein OmpA-like peptidoglycan-associated protein
VKARHTFIATLLALVVSNVCSYPQGNLGRFSFDYAILGDVRAKPVQVFDDGARTYLQFRQGEAVPALLSANGDRLFMPALEGPYVVITGTPRDLVAQMGLARSRITHVSVMSNAAQNSPDGHATVPPVTGVLVAGNAPVALPPTAAGVAASTQIPNSWTDNSYAAPRRGDKIEWAAGASSTQKTELIYFLRGMGKLTKEASVSLDQLARQLGNAAQVIVIGRDEESYKEGLGQSRARAIVDALVHAGVPRDVIVIKPAGPFAAEIRRGRELVVPSEVRWSEKVLLQAERPAPAPPAPSPAAAPVALGAGAGLPRIFAMRKSDENIQKMLDRWATESNWRLVWKGGPNVPIVGDALVDRPDFLQAADLVVQHAKAAGYRIKATAYSNQVLQIVGD